MSSIFYNFISKFLDVNKPVFEKLGNFNIVNNVISDLRTNKSVSVEVIQFCKKNDLYNNLELKLKEKYRLLSGTEDESIRKNIGRDIKNIEYKIRNITVHLMIIACNTYDYCDEEKFEDTVLKIAEGLSSVVLSEGGQANDSFLELGLDPDLIGRLKINSSSFLIKASLVLADDRIGSYRNRLFRAQSLIRRGEESMVVSGDEFAYATYLYHAGSFYMNNIIYEKSEEYLFKALKIFMLLPDDFENKNIAIGYVNGAIGGLLTHLNRYDSAFPYLKSSYDLAVSKYDFSINESLYYYLDAANCITQYYLRTNKFGNSLPIFNKVLDLLNSKEGLYNENERRKHILSFKLSMALGYIYGHQFSQAEYLLKDIDSEMIMELYPSKYEYCKKLARFRQIYALYFQATRMFPEADNIHKLLIEYYEELNSESPQLFAFDLMGAYYGYGQFLTLAKNNNLALKVLKKAVSIYESHQGSNVILNRKFITTLTTMIEVNIRLKYDEEANKILNKVKDLFKKYSDDGSRFYTRVKFSLIIYEGNILQLRNNFSKAVSYYNKAREYYSRTKILLSNGHKIMYSNVLALLALSYLQTSDYSKTIKLYDESIELLTLYCDNNRHYPRYSLVRLHLNKARAFSMINDQDEALRCIDFAEVELESKFENKNDLESAKFSIDIIKFRAIIFTEKEHFDIASIHYQHSIRICEHLVESGNDNAKKELYVLYNNYALLLKNTSDFYNALLYLEKSKDIIEYFLDKNSNLYLTQYTSILNNLGNTYMDVSKFDEAGFYYNMCHEYLKGIYEEKPEAVLLELSSAKVNLGNYYCLNDNPSKIISLSYVEEGIKLIWHKRDEQIFIKAIAAGLKTVKRWGIDVDKYVSKF